MTLTIKEVTKWEVDGRTFDTQEEAAQHVARNAFIAFLHNNFSGTSCFSAEEVGYYILDNFEKAISLLNKCY